jgi:3-hydroxyisobutyrate dehydrogenase
MSERIGFIGLGIMGSGMARNLLKAGFEVRVWNRSHAKMDALVPDGAITTATPAQLAADSAIIITCVSDSPDVEQVVLGEQGVPMLVHY